MPVPTPNRCRIPPGKRPSLNRQSRFGVQVWCNPVRHRLRLDVALVASLVAVSVDKDTSEGDKTKEREDEKVGHLY